MTIDRPPHDMLVARLERRGQLDEDDRAAIRQLPFVRRQFPAQAYLIREGEQPTRCAFILSGFAFRHKLTTEGGRQIVAIIMPGDFTDLQSLFLDQADHNVQSMTRLDVAELASGDLRDLAAIRPNVARALWTDALVEASISRETILNIGRRRGLIRLSHLLCEFAARLADAGLVESTHEVPMTQEQLGDATGMTSVHVNRSLRQLEMEGLVARNGRSVRIVDQAGLKDRAGFSLRYLHLDNRAAPA